jgi:5'-nucleotidase
MSKTGELQARVNENNYSAIRPLLQPNPFEHIYSMPKGTYLVDMDGVLFNYVKGFEEIWRRIHPNLQPFNPYNQKFFYVEDNMPKEYKSLIEEIIDNDPLFFEELPPIAGALEGIKKLAEKNKVYICTAPNTRNDYCASGKIKSIKKHLGIEWVRRTIITKDKTIVHGDYLIDDKPDISGDFQRSWTHILFDQPYNRNVETIYRFNWQKGLF